MIWLYQATISILPNLVSGTSATLKKIAEATISNSSPDESCQNDASPYTKSSLRDFFTVLALSFHAVFEGLAIGLEEESKDVWLLFAGNFIVTKSFHLEVIDPVIKVIYKLDLEVQQFSDKRMHLFLYCSLITFQKVQDCVTSAVEFIYF